MNTLERRTRLDFFDLIIGAILFALILLSPLPFGSVAPWTKGVILILALGLATAWLFQWAARGRIRLSPSPFWFFLPVAAVLLGFYLLPLTPEFLKGLSPATDALYTKVLPEYPAGVEKRTLSLDPHATRGVLAYWGALALIFVVVMNTLRSRSQVVALILVLMAVGVFEVIYGFSAQISGSPHVLWNERSSHFASVTGTFHNKNHFANLLAMIVPVLLGLFVAIIPRPTHSPPVKSSLAHMFFSGGSYRRLVLGGSLVLLILGIFFSLSKIGFLCLIGAGAGFAFTLSLAVGLRTYTLGLLILVLLVLMVTTGLGVTMIFDRIESVAYDGDHFTWVERTDLWQAGVALISEFPLLGTGPGTFASAFERFLPGHFSDRYTQYLFNDWLQLYCELGLVGGTVVVLCLLFILYRLIRKTLAQRDPFYRSIATGAMMGTLAMLVHSFFDCSLYRVAANGVVFVVILGLWHVTATATVLRKGARHPFWEVRFRRRSLGWVLVAGIVLLVFTAPWVWSMHTVLADIRFNRFLASSENWGKVDPYHFLKTGENGKADPRENLRAAIVLDGDHPDYLFYEALDLLKTVENARQRQALQQARDLIGPEIEWSDPEGFQQIVAALARDPVRESGPVNRMHLLRGKDLFRQAIDLAPARAGYHLNLASLNIQLSRETDARKEADLAVWLCPSKSFLISGAYMNPFMTLGKD